MILMVVPCLSSPSPPITSSTTSFATTSSNCSSLSYHIMSFYIMSFDVISCHIMNNSLMMKCSEEQPASYSAVQCSTVAHDSHYYNIE
jgi:hypothetical protein